MPDFTLGLLLAGKRRVLRFPDLAMTHNFISHARYPVVDPTDQPLRIVDVGACVGGWTLAQLMAAPNAVVDCFEPNPAAWPYLLNNAGWNKRVFIHKQAASDRNERVVIHPDESNMGKTSVYGPGAAVPVKAVRLDNMFDGMDLLKIDAEGHEIHVLAGAERILRESRPLVLVEVLREQMVRGGWTDRDLVALMIHHGYGGPEQINANDWLFRPKGKA